MLQMNYWLADCGERCMQETQAPALWETLIADFAGDGR